jgi:hypothetical protein
MVTCTPEGTLQKYNPAERYIYYASQGCKGRGFREEHIYIYVYVYKTAYVNKDLSCKSKH